MTGKYIASAQTSVKIVALFPAAASPAQTIGAASYFKPRATMPARDWLRRASSGIFGLVLDRELL
jgi:hypothetical protein